jgi:hypothetical protein
MISRAEGKRRTEAGGGSVIVGQMSPTGKTMGAITVTKAELGYLLQATDYATNESVAIRLTEHEAQTLGRLLPEVADKPKAPTEDPR